MLHGCSSSHGAANIPLSGKTLKVVQEINLKFSQGWWVSAPGPLKLIQTLVHGRCQDFELLIKQLSLNFAWRNYSTLSKVGRNTNSAEADFTSHAVGIFSLQRKFFFVEGLLKG